MKRSGGVTIAAVTLICASGIVLLAQTLGTLARIMLQVSGTAGSSLTPKYLMEAAAWFLAPVWGIATAVGLLRLRRWAWISMVAIALLLIGFAFPPVPRLHKLIRETTGIPTVSAPGLIGFAYVEIVLRMALPLALGLWWLILFVRKSVRMQFAVATSVSIGPPAVTPRVLGAPEGEQQVAPAAEAQLAEDRAGSAAALSGQSSAARSGGVTAAAIVLFLGSVLLILFMGLSSLLLVLPQPGNVNSTQQYQAFAFGIGIYGIFAAWGIVTGIGIFRLRNWARISILVMAGYAASCILFAVVSIILIGPMMAQMQGMNASAERVMLGIFCVMFAIPLGISIWWLVLFTRARVRAQFEQRHVPAMPDASLAPVTGAAPSAQVLTRDPSRIPASLIVIAAFLLLGSAFVGISIPLVIPSHSPFLLLGILLTGKKSVLAFVLMGIVELGLGIALLRKKPWSVDATIGFVIFGMLNGLLFLVSPARDAYLNFFLEREQSPPNLPPDFFPRMMHTFMPLIMGFTVAVNLVALYFLWTRRGAYRAECGAK